MIPPGMDAILTGAGLPEPLALGIIPSLLEYRADISRDLGIELFLKREDRVDDLGCGNKLRKLSYIVADAMRKEATVLLTVGSLPSNQCKAVAAVAARQHLRAHVIYGGDRQSRPAVAQGNYLITTLLDPTITWCEYLPWQQIEAELARVAEEERRRGERPYAIPPGATAWPGLLGSIELGFELAHQLRDSGLSMTGETDVVAPAGSGGTCLGIKMAAEQLGLPWRVFGICIGEAGAVLEERAAALRLDVVRRLGECARTDAALEYYDGAIGGGYAVPQADELAAMQSVVRRYGLLFDPNYMIKAFLGLRQLIATARIRKGARVILVHTGGQLDIFGGAPPLVEWHRLRYPDWSVQRDT